MRMNKVILSKSYDINKNIFYGKNKKNILKLLMRTSLKNGGATSLITNWF